MGCMMAKQPDALFFRINKHLPKVENRYSNSRQMKISLIKVFLKVQSFRCSAHHLLLCKDRRKLSNSQSKLCGRKELDNYPTDYEFSKKFIITIIS